MTTILVTGASGNLGSAVLPRLVAEGHEVRPMSRRARPGWVAADLLTGTGVSEAVRKVDVIVHLASSPTKTRGTDVEGTRRLLEAAQNATVGHILYVSIIGIDRVPLPYYQLKLETEQVIRAGGVPFTLLRAAQFPSLIDTFLGASSKLGPLLIDRSLVFQPVAVEDVADRITTLVAAGPAATSSTASVAPTSPTGASTSPADVAAGERAGSGLVEFAGPERLTLAELAQAWLSARQSRRPTWPIRVPGKVGRELRAGALTSDASPRGARTWSDYLAGRFPAVS